MTALALKQEQTLSLAQQIAALAPSMTCSQVAEALGLRVGRVARAALTENIAFGVRGDRLPWPRRGGPPIIGVPAVGASTSEAFALEARRRGTDPLQLAQLCLDAIAKDGMFAAMLDR